MKLNKLNIYEFRSIVEAEVPMDSEITTLVGANEHGKTNLLAAINLLDFQTPIKFGDKRALKNPIGVAQQKATRIVYEITLDQLEAEGLKTSFSANAEQEEIPTEPVAPTDGAATTAVIVKPKIKKVAVTIPTTVNLEISFLDGTTNNYSILDLDEPLGKHILAFVTEQFKNKIFYFDTFSDRVEHRISKEEILAKTNDVTNGLIKLSGLSGLEEALFEDSSKGRQLLSKGAEELTKKLKELWVQGKEDDIKVQFTLSTDGNFLNVDVEDFNTYGDVSTRSRGFLFFLAFILKFKQYHDGDLKNFIFLIDEPGIFLHPRGQKDLLQYLEKLAKSNQVVYTTHSPFMINRLNNFKVRVVSKNKDVAKGTEIDLKPFIHNWKSLRASLGMMLADSFYYADVNLITEGPSDRLYIISLLKYFNEKGFAKADLNILSIIDAGGCPNVPAMARIVSSEERPFIVLLDVDQSADDAKKQLSKFIEADKVKQINEFKTGAITIEDLLPNKLLETAVNNAVAQLVDDSIFTKPEKTFVAGGGNGVMQEIEAYCKDELKQNCISKLNIARHFDLILPEATLSKIDKANISELIQWVGEQLKIIS